MLSVLFLGGCMNVKAQQPQPVISNDEYEDLLERLAEIEEELGNLKQDLADGLYDCDGDE